MTSETKWECPHCSRFHNDLVDTGKTIEPELIIKCEHCGLHAIVEDITYFLHLRKPE